MKARVLAVLIVFTSTGMVARAQGVRDPFSGSVPSMPAMANPMTLTLRDVLDRANVFELTIRASSAVSDQVQILDRMVWHEQPMFVLKVSGRTTYPFDHVM